MREAQGDLWSYQRPGAVICITTNGKVVKGRNVMGRGCAKEARDRFRGIDTIIGTFVTRFGNRCFKLAMGSQADGSDRWHLVTFPTKHDDPQEESDPMLIAESAEQLVDMADKFGWTEVVVPRPGCGNGGLDWVDVRELLVDVLDDRFVIVDRGA